MRIDGLCHWLVGVPILAVAGCSSVGGQLGTLQTQNRSLLEQNKAQLAEIENLKTHTQRLADKLLQAEQRLDSLSSRDAHDESIVAATPVRAESLGDVSSLKADKSADNRKDMLR